MKKHLLLATLVFAILALFTACKKDSPIEEVKEPFDQEAMWEHWANNITIPAHKVYNTNTKTLHTQAQAFANDPTPASLEAVRKAWLESNVAWQNVPYIFPQGWGHPQKDLEDALTINNFFYQANTFPIFENEIKERIVADSFDTTKSRTLGLPAIEFMLYGLANTDSEILDYYKEASLDAEKHKNYLLLLTDRLQSQSDTFYNRFKGSLFVMENGLWNGPCSKRIISEFVIYYYLSQIMRSKVQFASCLDLSQVCDGIATTFYLEGRFSRIYSKRLLLEALNTAQDFFNGVPFGGSFENRRQSIYQYLDHQNALKDGKKLGDLINDQFDKTRTAINQLNDDLTSELENRIELMVNVVEQLEINRELLQSDMLNALDIEIALSEDGYSLDNCR